MTNADQKNIGLAKKAMISQPMRNKTDEEIRATREKAIAHLQEKGYEVVNTLFDEARYGKSVLDQLGVNNFPLFYLSKALQVISKCNSVYFCEGWGAARGCRIEHAAALEYGLEILYEDDGSTASVVGK